ncbi:MAG: DUF6029 family protein, partial [Bacteroidota bacterium]|nr:DUF6029 family protein [Bacteroidota bacterium]
MRSMLRLAVACTVLPACVAVAQVQYSVGNLFRFGNGTQVISGLDQREEYVENQSNIRLYWKDFTVGFQYVYDDPPEFGPTYQGVKKRYIEYLREGLELRAGDFYTLYDRGLTMNLFENRGLNYDTGLDGFRAAFNHRWFDVLAALGTMKYHDLLDPTYVETYSVRSGHIELKPAPFLRVGASLVGARGLTPARQTQSD